MQKELHLFGYVALIASIAFACNPTPNLDGTWRLHNASNASTRLLRFVGDSVFYLNPHQLQSIGGPVRFSKDSIILFNPWDAELHFPMNRVHDTVYLEIGLYLTKLDSAIAKDVSGRFDVTLPNSREEKTVVQDSKCVAVFLAPPQGLGLRPDTLFHGFVIGVNDQWMNPGELFSKARTELLITEMRSVLVYSDVSAPDTVIQRLASRFHVATGGRAILYRGYFCPQAEYYLTFEPIN